MVIIGACHGSRLTLPAWGVAPALPFGVGYSSEKKKKKKRERKSGPLVNNVATLIGSHFHNPVESGRSQFECLEQESWTSWGGGTGIALEGYCQLACNKHKWICIPHMLMLHSL